MDLFDVSLSDLTTEFVAFLPKLARGTVIFLIALYGSSWLAKLAVLAMEKRKADQELIVLLRRIVRWGILALGIIQALAEIGFNVTGVVAGLGIAGFTLGFALQDVAKNFVAGMLILLQQPFEIGDAVEVAGFSGSVRDITLRTTELRTWDGREVLIPNGDVYVSPIVNFSRSRKRRVEIKAGVAYDSDLGQVARAALEAVKGIEGLLEEPAPQIGFSQFGEASVEFSLYFWVDTRKVGLLQAKDVAIKNLKDAFQKEGVDMPFPRFSVRVTGSLPDFPR